MKGLSLDQWDERYRDLCSRGLRQPDYGGPLRRHAEDDRRLKKLRFDGSAAALRLWNFILTEEERLHRARARGARIIGTMKDLGTVPVLAYSLPHVTAFYPDGAWWLPCFKEQSTNLMAVADSLGIDDSFCPVRAMLGAFVTKAHFPIPDLLTCSAGAVCDDFSTIAQRLESLGHPMLWWEIPHRRIPEAGEESMSLPGGAQAPTSQVAFVASELQRIRCALEEIAGCRLDDERLAAGVEAANNVRRLLRDLRQTVFSAPLCPLPALEMLLAEMLALHYCSDRAETISILEDLLDEARRRIQKGEGVLDKGAARLFWVNPVADVRMMNLVEDCGGRVCGTDFMFGHALDEIPQNMAPIEALAAVALADPMAGSSAERARRICTEARKLGSEGIIISRIPGASHCAAEGKVIGEIVRQESGIPLVEIEVPPVTDAFRAALSTRLEAIVEVITHGRASSAGMRKR